MMKRFLFPSLLSAVTAAAVLTALPAQAGSHMVQPGTTAQIDVAERGGYTTITVINSSSSVGSLQLPTGGGTVTVPTKGRTELYDRYGNGPIGNAYVSVTNTGSVPLQVISRYTPRLPLP